MNITVNCVWSVAHSASKETKPELSMHLSVASPESGIASDEAISPLGHDSMEMSSGSLAFVD